MGYKNKVHMGFDPNEMTHESETSCVCEPANETYSIFQENATAVLNITRKDWKLVHHFNDTQNGTVLNLSDVDWSLLDRDECKA